MKSLALALLLVPVTIFAANVTVDCSGATPGAFTSINTAVGTLDAVGPNTVFVSGTCVENVVISSHDRVTLQGSPSATIQAASGTVLRVDRSEGVVLRGLTITGGNRGLHLQRNTDAMIETLTVENSGTGVVIDDGALGVFGGPNATQAVIIRNNSAAGASTNGGTFRASGNVTIENNGGPGIDAAHSRVGLLGNAAPNIVRKNGGNGVFAHAGSDVDMNGANQVTGNALTGILAFESASVDLLGSPSQFTTVDGNLRGGVVYIFSASGRVQNAVISNNGSANNPLSSGLTVANNASATVIGLTITGTVGPGVIVDSGGMARLNGTTISGGTAEPIRLVTGGILELQTGNTFTGTDKNVVVCDDSAVLFGDGATVPTSCRKTK